MMKSKEMGQVAPKHRAYVVLDGLRGIAALAVVTRHAPVFFGSLSIYVPSPDPGKGPVPVGPFFESYLAVDFFFVLSGFVLAHAYGPKLRQGMSLKQFMTIRLIRLYPLYFVALITAFVFSVISLNGWINWRVLPGNLINFLFAIFFLPSPLTDALFPLNVPAWSLFFELFANALYGLVARRLGLPALLGIVILAGTALAFSVVFGWFGFHSAGLGAVADGFQWHGFGAGMLRVTFSFFAGALMYRVSAVWRLNRNIPSIVVAVALAAVLMSHPPNRFQVIFDLSAVLVVFPLLVFAGSKSVPGRLSGVVFAFLGGASYAIYVMQVPVYDVLHLVAVKASGGSGFHWIYGFGFVVVVLIVASLLDKHFDQPVRRWLTALVGLSPATPIPDRA